MRILTGKQAEKLVRKLERRGPSDLAKVEKSVRRIVEDVHRNGDKALRKYAGKWDGLGPRDPLHVSVDELQNAWNLVSEEFRSALRTAAGNIRNYCERQKPEEW